MLRFLGAVASVMCVVACYVPTGDSGWTEDIGEAESAVWSGCYMIAYGGWTMPYAGTSSYACGSGGEICDVCASGEICIAGDCVLAQCSTSTDGMRCDGGGSIGKCYAGGCHQSACAVSDDCFFDQCNLAQCSDGECHWKQYDDGLLCFGNGAGGTFIGHCSGGICQ